MIDLYTWTTPNGYKPVILLEELGLPYALHPIDIGSGAQHEPGYLRINPNGKIPALVDHDHPAGPVTVFESGAILIYLGEKTGKLLPASEPARSRVMAWLMFQMSAVGPMLGQLGHFRGAPEKIPYAMERYQKEQERIYKVLDGRLGEAEYLGDEYSIADISTFTWVSMAATRMGVTLDPYPNLARWVGTIEARPAVTRALAAKIKP